MKIIHKYHTVLNYTINPYYFRNNKGFSKFHATSSNWRLGKDDVSVLKFKMFYNIKNKDNTDYFVKYESELQLHCIINKDEIESDAAEVVRIKKKSGLSDKLFLKNNTLSYFKLLNFIPTTEFLDEADQRKEAKEIKRSKGLLSLSEMTDEEREIYKEINNIK